MKAKILYSDKFGKKIVEFGNYIIAYGGDGTLLKAISLYRFKNKIFFGVAGGTNNFLMNKSNIISEDRKIKKFNLINVKVTFKASNKLITETYQAFNDVFITEENGWIDFNCEDNDNILGNFKGSGLIISTPQGSTGINKNNNGVILPLNSKEWSITGDKTDRKINYVLKQKKITIKVSSRDKTNLYLDGKNNIIM